MVGLSPLASEPLFVEDELRALRAVGRVFRRRQGHVFLAEGESSDFVLLVLKGHVKIVFGAPPRIVAVRGAGEIVGEMAAITGKPRSASVVALDEVEVLHLSAEQWLTFLHDHPRAVLAQLSAADARLEQANRKIVDSALTAEQRLAKVIVELVDIGLGAPGDDGAVLPVGQQELAVLAGISVDSVKKIIRTLREGRLVDTRRRALVVRAIPALRRIADGTPAARP